MRRFWIACVGLAACTSNGSNAATAKRAAAETTTTSAPICPTVSTEAKAGNIGSPQIDEASGIVASAQNPGVFWVHNDSGDTARAFALSGTGALLATLTFDRGTPIDIEDVAIDDEPSGSTLYFADIGDNSGNRPDVVIYRVHEPKLGAGTNQTLTSTSDKMHVKYPDGAHDAETLLFDPRTKDLFVVTKVILGNSAVYRLGNFTAGNVTATRVAGVSVFLATGGDITRAGDLIAIRNYSTTALAWMRGPNEDVATALGHPPCKLPVASEHQGEAFGFLADGHGYVTTSEGAAAPLDVARFQ